MYVYESGEGLAWAEVSGATVKFYGGGLFGSYEQELSLHTADDIEGIRKLNDESELLAYLAINAPREKLLAAGDFRKVVLPRGHYHPRVWRGHLGSSLFIDAHDVLDPHAVYGRELTSSLVAAESLAHEVSSIFRYIEPEYCNYEVFGHRLRELLILLCTEVEANFRAVYEQNFPSSVVSRPNTTHYHAVKAPLFLDQYRVSLKDYVHCEFSPFKDWVQQPATASIPWYEAYNLVKHDRNTNYKKSTLNNVLSAAAALHVLQVAQWGPMSFDLMGSNRYSIFKVEQYPVIPMELVYLPKAGSKSVFNVVHPFEVTT